MLKTLSYQDVIEIHESVILPEELQGLAPDKSLESALMRVDNKIQYGLINNIYELAAAYADAIASGHCFNDANKRTACMAVAAIFDANNWHVIYRALDLGEKIRQLANHEITETNLTEWLLKQHIM